MFPEDFFRGFLLLCCIYPKTAENAEFCLNQANKTRLNAFTSRPFRMWHRILSSHLSLIWMNLLPPIFRVELWLTSSTQKIEAAGSLTIFVGYLTALSNSISSDGRMADQLEKICMKFVVAQTRYWPGIVRRVDVPEEHLPNTRLELYL
jgi:hypothetical protein